MSIYWEEGGSFPFLILLKAFRYARKKLSDGGTKKESDWRQLSFIFEPLSTGCFLFSLYLYWREEVTWFLLEIESAIWVGKGAAAAGCLSKQWGNDVPPPSWRYFRRVSVCLSLSPLFSIQVARRPNFIYYYSVRSIDGTAADVYTNGRRTYTQRSRRCRRRQRRHVIELKIRENVGWCVWLEIFLDL
jgi:hypothetical protein